MEIDDIREDIETAAGEEKKERETNKRMAAYVAFLAAVLAIVNVGGSNAAKELLSANIEASDAYAFYQAKNLRQTDLRVAARSLELTALDVTKPETKAAMDNQIADWRATADRYESDPATGEGKKELLAKANKLVERRDIANRRDPNFDLAEATLELAIVLASVATVLSVPWLVIASGFCAVVGLLAGLNGFVLLVDLPF